MKKATRSQLRNLALNLGLPIWLTGSREKMAQEICKKQGWTEKTTEEQEVLMLEAAKVAIQEYRDSVRKYR